MTESGAALPLLRTLPLFEGLGDAQLEQLAATSRRQSFLAGETLIVENDDNDCLFVILEGEASVESNGTRIGRLETGDLAGEISAAHISPPMATVRAATEVRALAMPSQAITRLADSHAEFARRLRDAAFRRISG